MRLIHFKQPRFEKEMLNLGKPIKRISLMFLVYLIGWGIVIPYTAIYFKSIFGNYSSIGLIFSAQHIFALFWALLLGPLLDKINKKHLISLILVLYLPFSAIFLAMQNVFQFLLFRIYHSSLSTAYWLTSDAYLRGHTQKNKESQTMGLFSFSAGLALVIGGLLGALLIEPIGFKIFWGTSVTAFFALLVSFSLPDHTKTHLIASIKSALHFRNIKHELENYASNKNLLALTIYTFFYYFSGAFMVMILPLFLQDIGAELWLVGVIYSIFSVPALFQSYFSTSKDPTKTYTLGLVFAALTFLALYFTTNLGVAFVMALLLGIALAAVDPILLGRFTLFMPKKKVGEYSAVLFAVKSLASGLSPLFAGYIADVIGLKYVFLLGFTLLSGLVAFRKLGRVLPQDLKDN